MRYRPFADWMHTRRLFLQVKQSWELHNMINNWTAAGATKDNRHPGEWSLCLQHFPKDHPQLPRDSWRRYIPESRVLYQSIILALYLFSLSSYTESLATLGAVVRRTYWCNRLVQISTFFYATCSKTVSIQLPEQDAILWRHGLPPAWVWESTKDRYIYMYAMTDVRVHIYSIRYVLTRPNHYPSIKILWVSAKYVGWAELRVYISADYIMI